MIAPNDGRPAFPHNTEVLSSVSTGMTLRDWFAGQALAGLCAHPKNAPIADLASLADCESRARTAYYLPSAMLAEQGRGKL